MIKRLWRCLSKHRRRQFWALLTLMIITAIFEIISIGMVLPFLGVLTNPNLIYQHQIMQPLLSMLELTSPEQIILPVTIIFIFSISIATMVRLLLLYTITRFSFSSGADLSIDVYRRTLYQEYSVHISRNSSEVINGIISKTGTVINGILMPVLVIISSLFIIIGIMLPLFIINIKISLIIFLGLGFIYWNVIIFTRKNLEQNSQIIAKQSTQMIKSLQEGLGGIRDVLIDESQEFYCKLYRDADLPFRKASGNNYFISGSPRYVIEAIGMIFIAVIAYKMIQGGAEAEVVPILGMFALAAQKILPAIQQVYSSYSNIKGSRASFEDVLELLDQPLYHNTNKISLGCIKFEKIIELKDLSFSYAIDSPWVLKDVNLKIKKGECIGFMGITGGGKSTLIDIVMGLLNPIKGELIVDGCRINNKNKNLWQAHITHVPQNIYLSDSTIEENIAFGIPKDKIDHQQVKIAAEQAQISDLISQWKDGYQTIIKEQGANLSGGQRQRVGIARALYRKSDVLIFDEATSALDVQIEEKIMDVINNLDKDLTILIIAHRLSTLKNCDKILEINKKGGIELRRYEELHD